MMNRGCRILVLVCSLPLALPQGWCCMLARPTPTASKCCCPCGPASADPTPLRHCPCAERNATLPGQAVEKLTMDVEAAPVAPVVLAVANSPAAVDQAPVPHPGPRRSLHVLHCRWHC